MIAIAITAIVSSSVTFFILQQGVPFQQITQPQQPARAPSLEKFRAYGLSETNEVYFLLIDAGKDRGIWAKHGLDPEFIRYPPSGLRSLNPTDLVSSGVKFGLTSSPEVLVARSNGLPIKIVASYLDGAHVWIFAKADGPIRTPQDLDGKKIGGVNQGDGNHRLILYLNKKFSIKDEVVHLGNLTNQVVALKLGKIDAFVNGQVAAWRLVDSGELRVVVDFDGIVPKPWSSFVVYATEDVIQKNPDLVRRFIKATLETSRYLRESPEYAASLYIKRSNAPKDLAAKAVLYLDWTTTGRGTGQDLAAALANALQYSKDVGAVRADIGVRIEDAVDIRFLP